MPKWFSRRLRSSRAWRLSMPSFLKKSSSGAREFAGTWKCLEARASTSCVVWSIVRMDRSIYHHRDGNENSGEDGIVGLGKTQSCTEKSPQGTHKLDLLVRMSFDA